MKTVPLLLFFDVSTPIGSVVVAQGQRILSRAFLDEPREHAAGLIPAIAEALFQAGADRDELDGIIVGKGPGSFTGVRIAAATARGMVTGLSIPLWPRSSLAAAAASYGVQFPRELEKGPKFRPGELPEDVDLWARYILFDARGDRVYAGCYRFEENAMETVIEPHAGTIPELLESQLPEPIIFAGDGALRHRSILEEAGHLVLPYPAGIPTAEGLLRVHTLRPDDPPEAKGSRWEPAYLRGTSAKRPPLAGQAQG